MAGPLDPPPVGYSHKDTQRESFFTDIWQRWFISLHRNATALVNLATDVFGILPIANGGTNSGSPLSGQSIIISNGAQIVQGAAGTTSTVLHGNAAGAPAYGAVALGSEVSGDLPYANLTQATAASHLLGRGSAAGAGDWQDITLGSGVGMAGTVLSATGSGGTVTHTGALTADQLVLGNGADDIKPLGSAGTTTTILHGNAAGAPSFAAVALGADVTGVLPTANGGTSVDIASAALPLGSGQITFPATQNPSADANTLDDYEEGTWTPVIGGSGGTSGQTYSLQEGYYVKIGIVVCVWFTVVLSNKGTITTNVQIQGLPFTSSAGTTYRAACPLTWATTNTAFVLMQGRLIQGVTAFEVLGITAAATSLAAAMTATADLTNTTGLTGGFVYLAQA